MIARPGILMTKAPFLAAEAQLLFQNMTTQPTLARAALINQTITSLMVAGLWNKIDIMYVLAAADEQAARLNWKTPGTYTCTAVNSPTFDADRGFTGNGSSSYLDPAWNPSTNGVNFTLNSASIGQWELTNVTANTFGVGGVGGAGAGLRMSARTATNTTQALINDGTGLAVITPGLTSVGLTSGTRSDANTLTLYKSGASIATTGAIASIAVGTAAYFMRNFTTYAARQMSFGFWGGSLTDAEHASLYNIMLSYMTAVGAV